MAFLLPRELFSRRMDYGPPNEKEVKRMPPIIDTDKCIGCGICAQICDNEVLIIENKAKINKNSQDVRVYTGIEGRKLIFEDKLRYKSEQLVLGAHEPSEKSSRYMIPLFHKKRIKNKIHLKMLFPENQIEAAKRFGKLKYVKARIVPDLFNSPIAINIYANKIAILTGSGSESPLSILVENKDLNNDFKNYFFKLWKISKSI